MTLAIADDDDTTTDSTPPAHGTPQSPDGPIHVTRELECELNDAEIQERGEAMARDERECDRLKDRRKQLNAQIRGKLDNMSVLAKAIDSRKEVRDVACTWRPDYKRSVWELVRDDSGVIVDHRPMSSIGKQTRLPLESAAEAEAADEDDDAGDDAPGDGTGDGDPDDAIADGSVRLLPARSTPEAERAMSRPTKPAKRKSKTSSKNGKARR